MSFAQLFSQGDAVTKVVAVLLLAMSVASWVVILWKAWLLRRARRDVGRSTAAFWQSPSLDQARQTVGAFDREALVLPLIAATQPGEAGSLAVAGDRSQQLTRLLRDALHQVLDKLQFGQVLLASVGSTAPFVGLLGTVWGIYHALTGIATAGQITIDKVAGPVGEALIMTAAGLAVAIPAVLGYNVFGRLIGRIEADLEGFARDLRELMAPARAAEAAALPPAGDSASWGGPAARDGAPTRAAEAAALPPAGAVASWGGPAALKPSE
jgi:biopolymer transport protein ExbB